MIHHRSAMISKSKSKLILSLQKKKNRDDENLFVIEGDKVIKEFLHAERPIKILAAKPEFINSLPPGKLKLVEEIISISYDELKQLSSLKTPHNALAVAVKPELVFDFDEILNQLTVILDCIQDPGNLGTIIRAAAWFGIKTIVCSTDSVDLYNSKVIQASMGALLHVNLYYTDLIELLIQTKNRDLPVYGTVLEGESLYKQNLEQKGVIIFGNESKGISDDLKPYITKRIFIPGTGLFKPGIESLNVGMAASIILAEFSRRSL